uniref:Plectin/eS10 N-terminal domain-containing protein n=1 Tax=Mola mola TaxID=94237 RepID=A0A3Q3VYB0_MOLML
MLMPLRDLRAIYEVLFRDGVMVAKKDKRPQTKHPEIEGVSNLQVIRAMGSLKSRGCVKETFAWRHFYWYLTNEGIVYLRDYLHLPPEIVPASLQRVRNHPPPSAWCVVPPPLAVGEEADRSQQQAQLVKIQHKEETSQFRANKQEPVPSSSLPLCPALFSSPSSSSLFHLLDEDHTW